MPQFRSRVKQKMSQMPVSRQLILAITLIVFLILTAMTGFTYERTIGIINRQQSSSSQEILDLKRNNFSSYMAQLENYSMQLRYNDRLLNIMSSDKPIDYVSSSTVSSALRDTFLTRGDVVSYRVYLLKSQTCYSITRSDFNVRSFSAQSVGDGDLFQEANSAKNNYLAFRPEYGENGKFLTVCRVFINIINRRPLAFVEVTVDNSFCAGLSSRNSGMNSILGILNRQGQLTFTSDDSILSTRNISQVKPVLSSRSGSVSLGKKDYLTVSSDTADGNWKLVSLLPQDILREPVARNRNLSLFLALIAFLVSACLISMLIRIQMRPLQTLAKQMRNVGRGDFKTKVHAGGSAEISNLSRQFNWMTDRIDDLIQKNYVSELNEKIAQMKALEAQVDPHFLYNTLQAISTEAVLSGQKTIQQMIEALASLLRYSVREKDRVPIETEISHVRQYLFLQNARFEDRLAYEIQVDDAAQSLLIPKISILSLVENSIKHGLENSSERIFIRVCVQVAENELKIAVSDDGRGMTQQRLAEVRDMTAPEGMDESSSIGLPNLAARMKILYGERAVLSIASEHGAGTKVELAIPLNEEGGTSCINR